MNRMVKSLIIATIVTLNVHTSHTAERYSDTDLMQKIRDKKAEMDDAYQRFTLASKNLDFARQPDTGFDMTDSEYKELLNDLDAKEQQFRKIQREYNDLLAQAK